MCAVNMRIISSYTNTELRLDSAMLGASQYYSMLVPSKGKWGGKPANPA